VDRRSTSHHHNQVETHCWLRSKEGAFTRLRRLMIHPGARLHLPQWKKRRPRQPHLVAEI
jgi:hypothetical protein